MKSLSCLVLPFFIFAYALGQSPSFDLGPATPYNAFVFGDFTSSYSDSQGRLAIGGNAYLRHYSVGDQQESGPQTPTLVVGQDLTFPAGQVSFGNILVGGSASNLGSAIVSGLEAGAQITENAPMPFDFGRAEKHLRETSQALSLLESNTSFNLDKAGLLLQGDCQSRIQVFHFTAADMLASEQLQVSCIPEDAWILFNISGAEVTLADLDLSPLANRGARVLFHFPHARKLSLGSLVIVGSLLAPSAAVQASNATIRGQIVANSLEGRLQLIHQPFMPMQKHGEQTEQLRIVSIPQRNAAASVAYTYHVSIQSTVAEPLSFSQVQGPEGLTIDPISGFISWTPTPSQTGSHQVVIQATNASGLSDTQSFTITVVSQQANINR